MKKGACFIIEKVSAVTILDGAEHGNIESLVLSVLRLIEANN